MRRRPVRAAAAQSARLHCTAARGVRHRACRTSPGRHRRRRRRRRRVAVASDHDRAAGESCPHCKGELPAGGRSTSARTAARISRASTAPHAGASWSTAGSSASRVVGRLPAAEPCCASRGQRPRRVLCQAEHGPPTRTRHDRDHPSHPSLREPRPRRGRARAVRRLRFDGHGDAVSRSQPRQRRDHHDGGTTPSSRRPGRCIHASTSTYGCTRTRLLTPDSSLVPYFRRGYRDQLIALRRQRGVTSCSTRTARACSSAWRCSRRSPPGRSSCPSTSRRGSSCVRWSTCSSAPAAIRARRTTRAAAVLRGARRVVPVGGRPRVAAPVRRIGG
jgi:hypothetical protein